MLTVHKAKGLELHTFIVPGLDRPPLTAATLRRATRSGAEW